MANSITKFKKYINALDEVYKVASVIPTFLQRHKGLNILFLELGVGGNTPGIIKYPFWKRKPHLRAYQCCSRVTFKIKQ